MKAYYLHGSNCQRVEHAHLPPGPMVGWTPGDDEVREARQVLINAEHGDALQQAAVSSAILTIEDDGTIQVKRSNLKFVPGGKLGACKDLLPK